MSAKVEGRELPTQLPKATSSSSIGGTGSSDVAEGSDPLPGESEAEYVARQKLLQERARERMRAKVGINQSINQSVGWVTSYCTNTKHLACLSCRHFT